MQNAETWDRYLRIDSKFPQWRDDRGKYNIHDNIG